MRSLRLPALLAATILPAGLAMGAGPASAAEVEVPLTSLVAPGLGSPVGAIRAVETADGLVLHVQASGLAAGPNRLRVSDRPTCDYPLQGPGGAVAYRELGLLNADITEDGTEPVKATLTVPGLTLTDVAGKALVIYAGGQFADTQPQFRDAPMQLACGFAPQN